MSGHLAIKDALDDPFDGGPPAPAWDLDGAAELCRNIEHILTTNSTGYHAALGGSVLMQGKSHKDVDIFLYPHSVLRKSMRRKKLLKLLREKLNIQDIKKAEFNGYDRKSVYISHIKDQRIDFFFVK